MKNVLKIVLSIIFILAVIPNDLIAQIDTLRTLQYTSRTETAALSWQDNVRSQLAKLLKIDNLLREKESIPLNPKEILTEDKKSYVLKEVEMNSTPGRRIRVILTLPKQNSSLSPAVVCIHGHGGERRSVYMKNSIYHGFADKLASQNYVTIAGFVSQHEVYEDGMILMGERLWDLIRCVDFLESLPEVDNKRIGCAGLSLGGEMAMWLGAMDKRINATVSAGFLTNMDHMEQNHCMCWKFPGLRRLVDYADIYSLIAPRALQCQNGLKEPPTQFYVPLAREAFYEIEAIYRDFDRPENLVLDVHNGAHEVDLPAMMCFMGKYLKDK